MCSFISNSFIQLCCATASHNYGNQCEGKLAFLEERMNNKKKKNAQYFLTYSHFWQDEASASSQSMKRLSNENRKTHKQNKEKSSHKQPSATSHHLLAAWNTDAVCGVQRAAGTSEGFHSLQETLSPYTDNVCAQLANIPCTYRSWPQGQVWTLAPNDCEKYFSQAEEHVTAWKGMCLVRRYRQSLFARPH